ncbi:replication protein P [Celerinatantimonas sp. YJH-8]|uniref:replication protein P n=1 Tax=Celerinatantimonas sp. YJH-8 TaxID=3228714 RepID=UPI0038C84AE8
MKSIQEAWIKPSAFEGEAEVSRAPSTTDGSFFIEVWRQLKVAFPAWRQAFPTKAAEQAAKRVWLIALIENGVTQEQSIQMGLRMARQLEIPFFPSPGQFIKWCQPTPEMLGLPSLEQAYRQALTLRPTHAVVKAAIRATKFERGILPEARFHAVFERAYTIICRRYARGEPIDSAVSAALSEQAETCPVSCERGLDLVASVRRALGLTRDPH